MKSDMVLTIAIAKSELLFGRFSGFYFYLIPTCRTKKVETFAGPHLLFIVLV
tara:strand:+ start:6532 stop:6687 length:156 start_codon:yes stop_codon:yes gene_type:complete